jgi:hypothetical protein
LFILNTLVQEYNTAIPKAQNCMDQVHN